jgi:hypothetical protein
MYVVGVIRNLTCVHPDLGRTFVADSMLSAQLKMRELTRCEGVQHIEDDVWENVCAVSIGTRVFFIGLLET